MKKIFTILAFILSFSAVVYAQSYSIYPPSYLRKIGIDFRKFKIVGFSGNNKTLLCIEKVNNLQLRLKGYVWIIRILSFNPYNQLTGYRSVLLRTSNLDNLAINHTGTIAILVTDYGTQIMETNLKSGKSKILFLHQRGKPAFVCRAFIYHYHGSFYTEGSYYNSKGYWVSDAIVRLNLNHPDSIKLFQKTWNIGKTRKSLGKMQNELVVSGRQDFLGAKKTNSPYNILYYCTPKKCVSIDKSIAYGGWAATGHRILYSALRIKKNTKKVFRQLIVKDTETGKTWILYSGPKAYLYPYLSKDGGRVAITATFNFKKGIMSYFYAKEQDNFKLKPFPHLQNVPLGIFRLSPNGKHYAFLNRDGLMIGTLP